VCLNCDTGAEDHAWHHTFISCSANKTIMDWLVLTLQHIPIQDANIEMAIWLQCPPPIPENDLLCAVWLVGETLTYSWAKRRNEKPHHSCLLLPFFANVSLTKTPPCRQTTL
jgi:hypothetical protein